MMITWNITDLVTVKRWVVVELLSYKRLLIDSITYEPFVNVNQYNEREFGDEQVLNCFRTYKHEVIKSATAENIISRVQIFLDNTFEPSLYDRFNNQDVLLVEPITGLHIREPIGYKVYV